MAYETFLSIETDKLREKIPGIASRVGCYYGGDTHEIVVRLGQSEVLRFPVREWWNDACLARIALECP